MDDFLKAVLQGDSHARTVLRDYVSFDGFIVRNCPYRTCKDGLCPDGSDAVIPSNVMYRILEKLETMRELGIKELVYDEK